jgi:UV DNA damage endonuclease
MIKKVSNNMDCLGKILRWNAEHDLRFFRISSDMIPFASHPVCRFRWDSHFAQEFKKLGQLIKKEHFRISMHPDQFVLINAKDPGIVERSVKELEYHCKVLDLMGLPASAKVQIHVGGVYGDKPGSMQRFADRYKDLPTTIRKRLVVENDHKMYSLKDCLQVHDMTGIPILFDSFHHECLNSRESMKDAISSASATWKRKDGILMMDYSSQKKDARVGTHTEHIDLRHFKRFLARAGRTDLDIMLEIKDKEKSALQAHRILKRRGLL